MKKILSLTLIIGLGLYACKKDENNDDEKFDRGLMLKNYAENLIIPAYIDVQNAVEDLVVKIEEFNTNSNLQSLEKVQESWVKAYSEWQYANAFNIGPAAEQGLNRSMFEEISTFPASSSKIDAAVNSGQYSFSDFNRDARGFLALEYLLFGGIGVSNEDVLTFFNEQSFRKSYLKDCALNIQTRVNNVVSQWNSTFVNEFINRNGTDVGSSTSQLYNEFVKSFETNKNFKIELPLGMRPGQTQPEPQLVEAYYSGKSLDFLKIHLQAIENIYFGKSKSGVDGLGFKDYLENVTGGSELIESTLAQWSNVLTTINAIPTNEPLSQLIINNPQPVQDFRIELQKHTRFFKSDMSSLLGIAITYSSGDGD